MAYAASSGCSNSTMPQPCAAPFSRGPASAPVGPSACSRHAALAAERGQAASGFWMWPAEESKPAAETLNTRAHERGESP